MNSLQMKKVGTSIIVLLISICFIPALAGAFALEDGAQKGIHRKGHHRSPLGIWRNPQLVQGLSLTDDQVKQIKDADFSFLEKCLALKAQIDGFHLQMDKAFSDEKVDNTAVLSLAQKISDLKGKLFIQEIEARLTVGKILKKDQTEKLKLYKIDQKKQCRKHVKKRISG
jgi:Spy/CpxP family protein refolding chaperone